MAKRRATPTVVLEERDALQAIKDEQVTWRTRNRGTSYRLWNEAGDSYVLVTRSIDPLVRDGFARKFEAAGYGHGIGRGYVELTALGAKVLQHHEEAS